MPRNKRTPKSGSKHKASIKRSGKSVKNIKFKKEIASSNKGFDIWKYGSSVTPDKSPNGGSIVESAKKHLGGYANNINNTADNFVDNLFEGDKTTRSARDALNRSASRVGINAYKQAANANILEHAIDDLSLLTDIGLLPEAQADLAKAISHKNLDGAIGDLVEVDFKDHGVDLEGVCGIIGLPYMADNVVDPPPIWKASELGGVLNSWESGRCGKDFTKRVLERGQFLVLMPIELRPNITDTVALGLAGASDSMTSSLVNGLIEKIDSIEQRLNVASYGFTAKIAAKRYWRSVQAHAKAIMYALGIDEFPAQYWTRDNSDKKSRLYRYLPKYLVDNVYATTDMEMTLQNLQSGDDANANELQQYDDVLNTFKSQEIAESKEAEANSADNGGKSKQPAGLQDGSEFNKPKTEDKPKKKNNAPTSRGGDVYNNPDKAPKKSGAGSGLPASRGGDVYDEVVNKIKNNSSAGGVTDVLHSKLGAYDDDSNSLYSTSKNESGAKVTSMYTGSMMAKLIHFIMNIDVTDDRILTMPYTVFYCNGPIDRNYSWNIETGPSKLGEHVILGTKKKATQGLISLLGGFLSGGSASTETNASTDEAGKTGLTEIKEALNPISEMMNEWAYHNSGKTMGSLLINNLYIPKVQTGGGSQFSYTVPIRDMALSSDRYSLARLHFTLALLIPYVYQTAYPRQALIIPSSALYCSAFSKGVINCPRAVISNMSVKTDNAFQTTFGVPTELDITLTIEPLYTIGTTPDFNKYWSIKNHPYYFLGAMWNPMSSMNMLATLCGQNTVFSRMPVGLFEFYVGGASGDFLDAIRGGFASFRASVRDYFSSLGMSQNNYKFI